MSADLEQSYHTFWVMKNTRSVLRRIRQNRKFLINRTVYPQLKLLPLIPPYNILSHILLGYFKFSLLLFQPDFLFAYNILYYPYNTLYRLCNILSHILYLKINSIMTSYTLQLDIYGLGKFL